MAIVTFFLDTRYKRTNFLFADEIQHHCHSGDTALIFLGLLKTIEPIDGKSFMFTHGGSFCCVLKEESVSDILNFTKV